MKKEITNHPERANYVQNRDNMLEDFEAALVEAKKPAPSVPGIIVGQNFQDFQIGNIFRYIIEQEEYCELPSPYTDLKEEKTILKDMVAKAKILFGKDYNKIYKSVKL